MSFIETVENLLNVVQKFGWANVLFGVFLIAFGVICWRYKLIDELIKAIQAIRIAAEQLPPLRTELIAINFGVSTLLKRTSQDQRQVLLIEDSEADALLVREKLNGWLEQHKLELQWSPSFLQGKAKVGDSDLVIMDLSLPDAEITTVLAAIEGFNRTPVVLYTGRDDTSSLSTRFTVVRKHPQGDMTLLKEAIVKKLSL